MPPQPTVSHNAGHLLPHFELQLPQVLGCVDEDVSDTLRFSDVALEPEIRFDYFNYYYFNYYYNYYGN